MPQAFWQKCHKTVKRSTKRGVVDTAKPTTDNYRRNLIRAVKAPFRWAEECEHIDRSPRTASSTTATGDVIQEIYEGEKNCFVVLTVSYGIDETRVTVEDVHFVPIESLSWKCLTIGALGWGQMQIANADRIEVLPKYSRKKWMLALCDRLFEFYPREISKISERIDYFKRVRERWEKKTED
jgi:hypothetical protein